MRWIGPRAVGLVLLSLVHPTGILFAQEGSVPTDPEAPRAQAESRPASRAAEEFAALRERFEKETPLPAANRLALLQRILARQEQEVIDFLIEVLPAEKDESILAALARGLGSRAGRPAVASALTTLWATLPVPARQALAQGLKPPLPPELRATLLDRFWQEPDRVQIGLLPLVVAPADPEALALLERLFGDAGVSSAVQLSAARLLPGLPPGPDRNRLVEGLLVDPRHAVRAEAIQALDGADPARLLDQIREILDREVRATIRPMPVVAGALAERLARLGSPEALELFVTLAACRPVGLSESLAKLAGRFDSEACLDWWINQGMRSKDPEMRMLSMGALGASQDPRAVDALLRALRDPDDQARREAARSLGKMRATGAVTTLERMMRSGPLEGRIEALDALHQIKKGEPGWTADLVRLTGSRIEGIQARALDLLADLADPEVYPKVERLGRTRSWVVRSAFYGFAGSLRDPRAIPLLIDRLGQEAGRLQGEVEGALLKITGLTFGFDVRRWNQWWSEVRETFEPPPLTPGPVARSTRYGNTYYGIPVVSLRIAFLLDVSGSMAARMGTGEQTRLDRAKEALSESLTRFQKDTFFNVIYFHTTVTAWERQLTPALPDHKRRALSFVRSQQPVGATNIHDALEQAFADPEVDTIYLLSDGSPTTGKIIEPGRLLDVVLSWNRTRRIVIHTIALGIKSELMRRLAVESGGQYVEI